MDPNFSSYGKRTRFVTPQLPRPQLHSSSRQILVPPSHQPTQPPPNPHPKQALLPTKRSQALQNNPPQARYLGVPLLRLETLACDRQQQRGRADHLRHLRVSEGWFGAKTVFWGFSAGRACVSGREWKRKVRKGKGAWKRGVRLLRCFRWAWGKLMLWACMEDGWI